MLLNSLIKRIQNIFQTVYDRSFVLQNIDSLIGINILLVIFSSTFAQSDTIGNFALCTIVLSFIKLLTKTGEQFELKIADKFLLLYFIFVVISLAGSSLFYLSLKGFLKTVTFLGFYISIIHYLKDNKDKIKYIFYALAISATYETFYAFLQNFGAVEEIAGWQDMSHLNPEEIMTRVYGTLKPLNPNLFGGYMLAVIPSFLVIPITIIKNTTLNKTAKTATLAISLVFGFMSLMAIVFTGCRGAYIGLFFSLITLSYIVYKLLKPELRKFFATTTAAIAVAVSFIIVTTTSLRARIFSIFAMRNDSSNSFRFNVYTSCLHMFKDNWLLGIGCGNQNFREIYGLYMKTGFDALSAYNIYLETAVESGIFALLCLLGFIFTYIYKAVKFILSAKKIDIIYVLAALVSIVGMLTHGFVDTVFFRPQIQFTFWIMIGIIRVLVK